MTTERLKAIRLQILGDSKDESLDEIIGVLADKAEKMFMTIFNRYERYLGIEPLSLSVPDPLIWVVDDVTIKLFNLRGSEGYQSEAVEGHSVVFRDSLFEEYTDTIELYLDESGVVTSNRQGRIYIY